MSHEPLTPDDAPSLRLEASDPLGLLLCLEEHARDGVARLLFTERAQAGGPVWFRVRDVEGRLVMDRLLRELPTRAHSASEILSVPVPKAGRYAIQVVPLPGTAEVQVGDDDPYSPIITRAGATVTLVVG